MTHPIANQFLSNRIGHPQPSRNQQNPSGSEESRRFSPQPFLLENARSSVAGQGPNQEFDGSMSFYPPNSGDKWPYPPMCRPHRYYPGIRASVWPTCSFLFDYRSSAQNDPWYASFSQLSVVEMSRRSSNLDTIFQRQNQVGFASGHKEDVEEFIERIEECQQSLNVI